MPNYQSEREFSEDSINILDDRRREIRFNDGERAVIVWSHNAEARGPMELINRSQQGLCVRSEDAVPPGALGTILRILPWSEAENRRAVVTWCHADDSGGGNWDCGSWTVDPSLPKTSSGLTISVPAPSNVKDVVLPPIHDTVPVPVAEVCSKPNQASAGTWVK